MNRKKQAVWAAAAVCAVLLTGCGDNSSARGAADAGTGMSRTTVHSETSATSVTLPDVSTLPQEAGTSASVDGGPSDTKAPNGMTVTTAGEQSRPDLLDRAESALDSLGEAVTSVFREATRPR